MEILHLTPETATITAVTPEQVTQFLFEHLDRYGDPPEHIRAAIAYALQESDTAGGYVLIGLEKGEMVGAVVVNKTGMAGYIPENILVYIAVHRQYRGKGFGKQLMKAAIQDAEGAIALHVEPDNPARRVYEKLGFSSKYLEMRLTQDN